MSYIERLLVGVEVEWMPLGEVSELVRGIGLQKKTLIHQHKTGQPKPITRL